MHRQDLLIGKLKSLSSQVSANAILDLIKRDYELKMESNEMGRRIDILQEQLQVLIKEDADNQLIRTTGGLELDQQDSLENDLECLKKDIGELEAILEEINNYNQKKSSQEEEENDSYTTLRISQKIHLSNNIIRWLRGPAKIMFNGTMRMFDMFARGTHISDTVIQAVKRGYEKEKQISFKSAFAEITSDWRFESENLDRGFNSPSIWMRDPQDRRILVKTQGHPLCAANEWLAYTLGKQLGLPVNEVQISIYQNNLVTLHTDVAHEHEKIIVFMDLPRQTRRILLTNTVMGCMALFDHIIQNADRNQRNILITTAINDDPAKMKVHLIDHASCFGMGKLNVISLIACKFHTNHLSIVKFDPIDEARKFEQYLTRLPTTDRKLIKQTLNHFAAITNDQFDSWINEVQDLLSPSQYNRIRDVLYQQRDIVLNAL